jgi:hypothetical protein
MRSAVRKAIAKPRHFLMRLRVLSQGRAKRFEMYLPYLRGKSGVEIGGPSTIFRKGSSLSMHEEIGTLASCDFAKSTVWAKYKREFIFSSRKPPGRTIFCEGSALVEVPESTYDGLLSLHNLERFANPVRALIEWKTVLTPNGAIVPIVPFYRATFDHRRQPTSVDHMFDDFKRGIEENNLTHLPETLEKHDLRWNSDAGSPEEFRLRSLDNLNNRCLHHDVFD